MECECVVCFFEGILNKEKTGDKKRVERERWGNWKWVEGEKEGSRERDRGREIEIEI